MTTQIDPRILKARTHLIIKQPFFGTLALYLKLEENEAIGTMATDGDRIIYAPSFLGQINAAELQGVLAHEVLHCAYLHHCRRNGRDPDLWNQAADYAINRDLLAAGFTLPKDRLHDPKYAGMGAEEIYVRLKASQAPRKPAGGLGGAGGYPGKGQPEERPSGAGKRAWGAVLDAKSGDAQPSQASQAEKAAEWERRARQAVAIASKGAGAIPGQFQELIKVLNKPKIDWREELRRFIDSKCRSDYTWTQPNKRFLHSGFVLPGQTYDGLSKLGIVLDTSGSIDLKLLRQFSAELQAAMDEGAAEEVVVIQCDTRVTKVERFSNGDSIDLIAYGRGGTKFGPALDWFQKNEPDVAALIYFTDLDSSDFGQEPSCPLLWAAYGYESTLNRLATKVPFGEIIKVVQ